MPSLDQQQMFYDMCKYKENERLYAIAPIFGQWEVLDVFEVQIIVARIDKYETVDKTLQISYGYRQKKDKRLRLYPERDCFRDEDEAQKVCNQLNEELRFHGNSREKPKQP